jgi:hypothetical protein
VVGIILILAVLALYLGTAGVTEIQSGSNQSEMHIDIEDAFEPLRPG